MSSFDTRPCALGEGPLWHPLRNQLFWFDILGKRLLTQADGETTEWPFEEHFSAAGWIDIDTLMLASETALWRFDIASGAKEKLCDLDSDNQVTRSNDGRADPWGGFWIGTMGKDAEPKAGAIRRYYRGEVRLLVSDVTVSNAICFAPDRSCAYYTDTVTQQIMRQPLDPKDGWPMDDALVHIDLRAARLYPDGAVTDAAGNIWVAMWRGYCVICFAPDGSEVTRIKVPAQQITCPAFGGPDLHDMYVTTAAEGLRAEEMETRPLNGTTFVFEGAGLGLPEPQVIL